MNNNEILNLIEKLNKEKFLGLKDYQVGDAMYFAIQPVELYDKFDFSLLSYIKNLFSIMFIRSIQKGKQFDGANKIFLFSNSYWGRLDHKILYDKIYDTAINSSEFIHTKKLSIYNIKNVCKFINWFNIFKHYFSKKKARYYTCVLARAYSDFEYMVNQLGKRKTDVFITLCDVHLIDSLVTQYCNRNSIDTVTMQHGNLPAGPAYGLSKSKYFLGYGEYTRKVALSSGLKSDSFVPVGMPQYIGKNMNEKLIRNNTNCIGVLFCNYETIEDDTRMLNIVLDYAEQNDYEVFVKIHPACSQSDYSGVDWNRVKKIYGKEIDIYKFSEYIDFAAVGISTVFIEYVINLFPCMCFKCEKDKYSEITWNKFSTISELKELSDLLVNKEKDFELKMKETRQYFTPVDDISKNYSKFFSRYDNK